MSSQHGHGEGGHFVAPLGMYIGVWVALMVLTVITVGVALVDFGSWNIAVAMFVAVIKASLVALFFMGLAWDDRMNAVIFSGGLIFLAIFFLLTFPDLLFRDLIDPVRGNAGSNPAAYHETGATYETGHRIYTDNHSRLYYGAESTTGAPSGTSGVMVLSSADDVMPGGSMFGKAPKVEGEGHGGHGEEKAAAPGEGEPKAHE